MDQQGCISSASANLTDVIVSLPETLAGRPLVPPNEVQTSGRENGPACAVIVLVAIVVEGSVNRLRYFVDNERCAPTEDAGGGRRREHVPDRLEGRLDVDLYGRCEEIFCVRDVMAHAHTWHATTNPFPTLHFAEQPRLHRYGDQRFRRVIDKGSAASSRHASAIAAIPRRVHAPSAR